MTADLATTHADYVAAVLDVDMEDCGCCVEILTAGCTSGFLVPADGYLVMAKEVYARGRHGDRLDK